MSLSLHDIKIGLDNDEFVFFYQPKVSFLTGEMVGAEALVRWHKDGSLISPDAFIPMCEQTGFITLLTENLFNRLTKDLDLIFQTNKNTEISFNISGHDLKSRRFFSQIETFVKSRRFNPKQVQLELTETMLTDLSFESIRIMHDFDRLGIALSLDDFGAGFSSLEVLSTFPFSTLKLDRSLIKRIHANAKARKIISATIRMAQRIGLQVVAEGIEDQSTYRTLLYGGCHQGQGFFMSRPLSLECFLQLLHQNPTWEGKPIGLIYQAQLDHIQWRKDMMETFYFIRNAICPEIEQDLVYQELRQDHHHCNLGLWYAKEGKRYAHYPQYQALEQPHRRLHEVGQQLLSGVIRDKDDAGLPSLIHELNQYSGKIIQILQDMEHMVRRDDTRGGGNPEGGVFVKCA